MATLTLPAGKKAPLARLLAAILAQHQAFARLVLPATLLDGAALPAADSAPRYSLRSAKRPRVALRSPLSLLRSHELVLSLVAEFVGVVRGRGLRNVREAAHFLRGL